VVAEPSTFYAACQGNKEVGASKSSGNLAGRKDPSSRHELGQASALVIRIFAKYREMARAFACR
jgi:hypothetical protein